MRGELTSELISDESIVINYIDEYLYGRLRDDKTKSVGDFVNGGGHIAIKSKDRIVGIISFGLNKDHAMIHPKIRKEHMIYAKRACMMGIEYLDKIGESVITAKIPDCFNGNKRMAEACGMKLFKVLKDDRLINGKPVDVNVYLRVL